MTFFSVQSHMHRSVVFFFVCGCLLVNIVNISANLGTVAGHPIASDSFNAMEPWRQAAPFQNGTILDMAMDSTNATYILLTNSSGYFLMKFDVNDTPVFTYNYPIWSAGGISPVKLAVDSLNNVYIGGNNRTSAADCYPFIVRYTSTGTVNLNVTLGAAIFGDSGTSATNITMDNLEISADLSITVCFGTNELSTNIPYAGYVVVAADGMTPITPAGSPPALESGTLELTVNISTILIANGPDNQFWELIQTTSPANLIYLCDNGTNPMIQDCLPPTQCYGFVCDANNNLYILASNTITTNSTNAYQLMKYSPTGTSIWNYSLAIPYDIKTTPQFNLAQDNAGNLYIAGMDPTNTPFILKLNQTNSGVAAIWQQSLPSLPTPTFFVVSASDQIRVAGMANITSSQMVLVAISAPSGQNSGTTTISTNAMGMDWVNALFGNITFPRYYLYIGAVAMVAVMWLIMSQFMRGKSHRVEHKTVKSSRPAKNMMQQSAAPGVKDGQETLTMESTSSREKDGQETLTLKSTSLANKTGSEQMDKPVKMTSLANKTGSEQMTPKSSRPADKTAQMGKTAKLTSPADKTAQMGKTAKSTSPADKTAQMGKTAKLTSPADKTAQMGKTAKSTSPADKTAQMGKTAKSTSPADKTAQMGKTAKSTSPADKTAQMGKPVKTTSPADKTAQMGKTAKSTSPAGKTAQMGKTAKSTSPADKTAQMGKTAKLTSPADKTAQMGKTAKSTSPADKTAQMGKTAKSTSPADKTAQMGKTVKSSRPAKDPENKDSE